MNAQERAARATTKAPTNIAEAVLAKAKTVTKRNAKVDAALLAGVKGTGKRKAAPADAAPAKLDEAAVDAIKAAAQGDAPVAPKAKGKGKRARTSRVAGINPRFDTGNDAVRPAPVGERTIEELAEAGDYRGETEAEAAVTETQGEQDAKAKAAAAPKGKRKAPAAQHPDEIDADDLRAGAAVEGGTARPKGVPEADVATLPQKCDTKGSPEAPYGRAIDGTPLTKYQWAWHVGKEWARGRSSGAPRADKVVRTAKAPKAASAKAAKIVDAARPLATDEVTVRLGDLATGTRFKTPDDAELQIRGWAGTLLYANECRARVRTDRTKATTITPRPGMGEEVAFDKAEELNISPNCRVVVLAAEAQ